MNPVFLAVFDGAPASAVATVWWHRGVVDVVAAVAAAAFVLLCVPAAQT